MNHFSLSREFERKTVQEKSWNFSKKDFFLKRERKIKFEKCGNYNHFKPCFQIEVQREIFVYVIFKIYFFNQFLKLSHHGKDDPSEKDFLWNLEVLKEEIKESILKDF